MNIDNACLGTRYLINYINTKNPVYLDVVKNCTKEIAFFALLMHFCNNMNDLFDSLPEEILKKIFTGQKVSKVVNILSNDVETYSYGNGYYSNIQGDYKTQLRLIRNALAHKTFEFDGKTIKVYNPNTEFVATFDYDWFKSLVLSALSNANCLIKKGIEDYTMIRLSRSFEEKAKDIKTLENTGSIKLLKITCVAHNSSVISSKFPNLAKKEGIITFDDLKITFIRVLSDLVKKEGFAKSLEKLKKAYKGIFEIEILNIKSDALSDPDFLELPLADGIDYLINEASYKDKNNKSTINLKRILELLDNLDNNVKITLAQDYGLNDTLEFLLNLYGYIYFFEYPAKKSDKEKIESFSDRIDFRIIHAKNVWSEYIKKISKSIDVLISSNASRKKIEMWEKRLKMYKLRLEKVLEEKNNILNLLRNSLTHGLVEHTTDTIIFYGEEPVIKLPKINSKTKELTEYSFQNKGRTFEIKIAENTYLSLLDSLYESVGINIKVNISKYRKRSDYLNN